MLGFRWNMKDVFERLIDEAHERPLVGWDFSLDGRITVTPPEWNFEERVSAEIALSPDLLDMGTGGGEWLSRLSHRPVRTVATEGWPPNVPIARRRLEPLGVHVIEVEGAGDNIGQQADDTGGYLPLPDSSFHLISNRHESYLPSEVARILLPGGKFLTQQVSSGFNGELLQLLGEPVPPLPIPDWNLAFASEQIEQAGLMVQESGSGWETLHFADIGALAWYLLNLPRVFAGFTIERFRLQLVRLHQSGQPLCFRLPLFWFEALKPG